MNFEKAKNSYRKNAIVQEQMAKTLVEILVKIKGKTFEEIFEIGSGTGFLTDEIASELVFEKLILNDLTENYTSYKPYLYIQGDINEVIVEKKFDLIASNAVFQWIEDYQKLFLKLKNLLKKNGVLAFSYFGEKNFSQIKDITGVGLEYPNLEPFIKMAGFQILYVEEELKTLYFKDVIELLEHIKLTGVKTENKSWTKSDYNFFKEKYSEKYNDALGFELTYHPIYYILSA